jgi:valyl-tRNA synthetase
LSPQPETLLDDTTVAARPENKRYKDIVGHFGKRLITDRLVSVIADEYVEKDFGTGMVKLPQRTILMTKKLVNAIICH